MQSEKPTLPHDSTLSSYTVQYTLQQTDYSPGHDVIKGVPKHLDAPDLELVDGPVTPLAAHLHLAQPQHVEDGVARHFACVSDGRRRKVTIASTLTNRELNRELILQIIHCSVLYSTRLILQKTHRK